MWTAVLRTSRSLAGAVFKLASVGRGAAFGDIDNDGDTDVVVANDNGPPRLLVNNIGNRNHWAGFRITGGEHPRDMLGAQVEILLASGARRRKRVHTDGSYASASDPRVMFGLGGDAGALVAVRVQWPDGKTDNGPNVPIDRYTTLKQGTGQ
jgi:hypothetical protein